jgi:hypothetical protein
MSKYNPQTITQKGTLKAQPTIEKDRIDDG